MWWKGRQEQPQQPVEERPASPAAQPQTGQTTGDAPPELVRGGSSAESLRKLSSGSKASERPSAEKLSSEKPPQPQSWWLWPRTAQESPEGDRAGASEGASEGAPEGPETAPETAPEGPRTASETASTTPEATTTPLQKSYAWFLPSRRSAELAVAGTPSESQPKEAAKPPPSVSGPTPTTQTPTPTTQTPSVVVPSFDDSFPSVSLVSRLWAKHPYRVAPPRISKAVVVGIHGYFPARISRKILGEPTGTSIKFATEGAAMLEEWARDNGRSLSIEKIALEGEGRIAQREETLYGLLKNWLDTLRSADFIFFAVHSQGAVVGVHIIARLLEEYKLKARIGLLTMAGVCLGPMQGMDQTMVMKAISTIENASLMELFELQNPESVQSQKFAADLSFVLRHGVKFVCVASADDQLVPLYSALCVHADHPNIFRAVYLEQSSVLVPLLELAVRRRNSGLDDFDTLKEISSSLAGALTGSGHSRLYGSDKVYRLALKTILESSCTTNVAPVFRDFKPPRRNPYVLPWSLHALVSEPPEPLRPVVARVYEEYAQWRPETKALKELRYRLGALKNVGAKL